MACCKAGIQTNDGKAVLEKLRNYENLKLNIDLNEYKISFNQAKGEWESNLHTFEIENLNEEIIKSKLLVLIKDESNIDNEILELEKEYQANMAQLLIITKVVSLILHTIYY